MSHWDEAEHPRDRRGRFTESRRPDSGAYVFSGTSQKLGVEEGGRLPNWAGATLERMGFGRDRHRAVDQVVARGHVVERSPLAGGQMAQTQILYYSMPDGTPVGLVHKNHGDGWMAERERKASLLGQAIGAPIPAVIMDPSDGESNYMELFDGDSPDRLAVLDAIAAGDDSWYDGDGRADEFIPEFVNTDEGRLLGLFDLLWGNTDRHTGNWLIDDARERIAGIDHTHHDLGHPLLIGGAGGALPVRKWSDSPFSAHFTTWSTEHFTNVLGDNDMHIVDMELIRERIEPLRHEFTPAEWLDLQERLALITEHARGTRRRLS